MRRRARSNTYAARRAGRLLLVALAACLVSQSEAAAQADVPLAERIKQCAACHGEGGNSTVPNLPSLAGQPEFFLINQLVLIREGVRAIEEMASSVKGLKDSDIEALAKHFAGLQAKPSKEAINPVKVERGKVLAEQRRCGSCHKPDLEGQEQIPRLAKQRVDYLVKSMKDIRDNRRRGADSTMTAAVIGTSDADLVALAHYAASR